MYFFDYGNAFLLEASRAGADILNEKGDFKIELVPLKDRDTIIIEDITIDLDNELL